MNMLDYQASIIEARKTGKIIQACCSPFCWVKWDKDVFDFSTFRYRVKPEVPVVYVAVVDLKGGPQIAGPTMNSPEDVKRRYGATLIDIIEVEYEPK
jgi:hypothetical protein